ncbi:MAG: MFS transporter [Ilumatobacteraceae bacterium]
MTAHMTAPIVNANNPGVGPTMNGAPSPKLGSAYWRLWTASTISNLGDGMFLVALPLLAARTTSSPFEVSLVTAFSMLPWLLVSLHAGAIVDRSDKRKLLITGDVFRGIVILTLTIVVAMDAVQMWMLWSLALCLGVAEVVFDNAAQAILPAIVEPELLEKANGRRYSAELTANIFLGTPLGGALFALAIWLPFGVDAVSYLAAAILVIPLRGTFKTARCATFPKTTLSQEVREGFRWLWGSKILRGMALALACTNLGLGMTPGLFILYVQDELHVSERWYGAMLGVMALGGITAGLVGERIIARLGKIGTLYAMAVGWVAVMATIGLVPQIAVVLVAETLGVFAVTLWNIGTVSLRQQLVPAAVFGRVNSVYRWFAWGAMPVGAALGGVIAQNSNQRYPYLAAAACVVVGIGVMSRTVTLATLREAGGRN